MKKVKVEGWETPITVQSMFDLVTIRFPLVRDVSSVEATEMDLWVSESKALRKALKKAERRAAG